MLDNGEYFDPQAEPGQWTDSDGRVWETASEALAEFTSELPPLTGEESELLCSFTLWNESAEFNLAAYRYGIAYHGLSHLFAAYPVPYRQA